MSLRHLTTELCDSGKVEDEVSEGEKEDSLREKVRERWRAVRRWHFQSDHQSAALA